MANCSCGIPTHPLTTPHPTPQNNHPPTLNIAQIASFNATRIYNFEKTRENVKNKTNGTFFGSNALLVNLILAENELKQLHFLCFLLSCALPLLKCNTMILAMCTLSPFQLTFHLSCPVKITLITMTIILLITLIMMTICSTLKGLIFTTFQYQS